jgi:hypothetical protein
MEFYNTFRLKLPSSGNNSTYPELINVTVLLQSDNDCKIMQSHHGKVLAWGWTLWPEHVMELHIPTCFSKVKNKPAICLGLFSSTAIYRHWCIWLHHLNSFNLISFNWLHLTSILACFPSKRKKWFYEITGMMSVCMSVGLSPYQLLNQLVHLYEIR